MIEFTIQNVVGGDMVCMNSQIGGIQYLFFLHESERQILNTKETTTKQIGIYLDLSDIRP